MGYCIEVVGWVKRRIDNDRFQLSFLFTSWHGWQAIPLKMHFVHGVLFVWV